MISKQSSRCRQQQQQYSLSLRSTVLLIIFSSYWIQLASAKLSCTSPTSSGKSKIHPGTAFTLGFSGAALDTALSTITADLVCSSTGTTALSLGSGYNSSNYSPESPQVTITDSQAAEALASCPSNAFHVKYSTSSSLSQQVASCKGVLSIDDDDVVGSSMPTSLLPSLSAQPSSSETATSQSPIQTITTTAVTATATVTTSGIPVTTPVTTPEITTATTPAINATTVTTSVHTTTPPKSTTPSIVPTTAEGGSGGGGDGNNGGQATSSDSTTLPSPSGNATMPSTASEFQSTSSPPTAVVAGAGVGVVASIFVILAGLLIWRKRQQRKRDLDLFIGDSSLAAASGFSATPIYARSDPDEDRQLTRDDSVMVPVPMSENMSRSQHGSPPPLAPTQPYPAAISMGQQDMGYYNEEDVDYYQQQSSYRLPYSHPNYDYNSYGHHHGQ
ncbi:hypothetical protein BGZ80_008187 [Entomortierella chlamydospora]|uniref:Uncharacterized protein n=1 Tax=Entomortierella chlamydospora TaxID=101097 RepID=A0A9P6MYW7_9FUNG|nr:hypothetical protein BGZ79_005346 [Entomortierella chlamydospora]KAG0017533.1 hypothetical protein BGZ80_008187 [Entomortierella chlamydospora]